MAPTLKLTFISLLLTTVTLGAPTLPENQPDLDPVPLKINKNLYPKKYQPISLKKFRVTTEEPDTGTVTPTSVPGLENVSENQEQGENTTENMDELILEDLTESQEEFLKAMERTRKSASTTFCVEVRPGNPYQKPFHVCQPNNYHPNTYHPRPYKPYYPSYQPTYQQVPQVPAQPQQPVDQGYGSPVMVLPHVPVAEPYHVPKPVPAAAAPGYKPAPSGGMNSAPGSSVYRMNNGEWASVDVALDSGARSAYGEGYGGYEEEKTPLFDFHKKKELTYVPFVTHSISKTKPLKILKLLKDLKKDKFEPYDDYHHVYSPPHYDHHYEPDYHHESSYHKDSGSSSHGLVITCQPSAVGYTGQQNQLELAKHMDLLKNIYHQSEKLYNQQQLTSGAEYGGLGGGSVGGGYVSPGTYRSAQANSGLDATLGSTGGSKWQGNKLEDKISPSSSSDVTGTNPTLAMMGPTQSQAQAQMQATIQGFRNSQMNV